MCKEKTEFFKKCPGCKETQYYSTKYGLAKAIKNNVQCLTCSNKGQGFLDYGEYRRTCPQCKKPIYYNRRGTFLSAIRNNSTCKPCSYERRKIPPKELKEKRRKYKKNYYKDHSEEIKTKVKKWRENNEEKRKKRSKKYYQEHIEERKAYGKKWREKNKEMIKIKGKKWREENKEILKIKSKKRREKNKEIIREKDKISYQENKEERKAKAKQYREGPKGKETIRKRRLLPKNRLYSNISTGIGQSINLFCKNKEISKNGKHWEDIIGYKLEQLLNHLEKQFTEGMSWDNYGKKGWELEHIVPVAFFDFDSMTSIEFLYMWSLNNLRPMWRKNNLEKGDKITIWGKEINARYMERDYFSKIDSFHINSSF